MNGAGIQGGGLCGVGVDVVRAGYARTVVSDGAAVQRAVQIHAADYHAVKHTDPATFKRVRRKKMDSTGVRYLKIVVSVVQAGRVGACAGRRAAVEVNVVLAGVDVGIDRDAAGLGCEDGARRGMSGSLLDTLERKVDGQYDSNGNEGADED